MNPSRQIDIKTNRVSNDKRMSKMKRMQGRYLFVTIVALIIGISLIGTFFARIINNFSKNIAIESSDHLEEINYQIMLYIESQIENDWQIAYSVSNNFTHGVENNNQESIMEFLAKEKEIWNVDDIILYTENGIGIGTSGKIIANDVASSTMYNARQYGEYMSIIQSTITYTLSVESDLQMNDSKITAISIERDLQTFLDSMKFSSFNGSAFICLTQGSGRIISQLTTERVAQTFNIQTVFQGKQLECLTDSELTSDAMFTTDRSLAYLLKSPEGIEYVVVTPVVTRQNDMNLVYMVPSEVVNQTLDRFSRDIATFCIIILVVFVAIIIAVFRALYISRKKQFSQALISRERTFDLLVANTNTAFVLLSVKQVEPIYISANVENIVGTPVGRLLRTEQGFCYLSENGSKSEALQKINRELANWDGRSIFSSGYIARPTIQGTGYFEVKLYPVNGDEDEYVGIIQDMTQQFNREETVKSALEMAERANDAKSRFLSNMSHDIRTPMNAIVNMTQFAKENKHDPELLNKYLDIISESSDHLLQLINDVLDMSRIESGQAVMEQLPLDMKAELNKIAGIVSSLCQNRNQSFLVDFTGLRSCNVLGDQVKVSQILMNLLGNAVKFTPEGGTIGFKAMEIPSLRTGIITIRFVVSDTGIGIPEENLGNVFEAFVRVDNKRTSKIEGTGLGLSICKSYVNAMGGTLTCKSEVGKGSIFTVELSFEETEDRLEKQKLPDNIKATPFIGKRCLLCEDNNINQLIARKVLEDNGFTVDIVSDGLESVNCFLRTEDGYYDIIYMDIQMPVMDGYEAATAIRESGHPQAKTIPIIAMTANVFAEDVERARVCGMNGHLGKPINIRSLVIETDKLLNRNGDQL